MFVHTRTHSDYSLLKSSIKVKNLISLSVKNSMPAIALTDTGNLFGALEFADCAANAGIQPIIGCEIMVEYEGMLINSVLLLVKNYQGYSNLVNLVSNSFKKTGVMNNTINIKELFNFSCGLIVLTGGTTGILAKLLSIPEYFKIIPEFLKVFSNNIYVELQRHGLDSENQLEKKIIDFSYDNNLPLIATNEVFFAQKEDFESYEVLRCIAEGGYIAQEDRVSAVTTEHYFKSIKEMSDLFIDIPEAIQNTVLVAQRCSFMPEIRKPILPRFPCEKTEAEELSIQAKIGLKRRISGVLDPKVKDIYYNRLNYELNIIISMNYSGYFLIVSDFIIWAKNNNVPVGPGRGSGAGSLVAWSLQITELDPISFGLIFERFLNPDRISMPDFDIDFCQEKRGMVIEYVQKKYGYVAQIITFGKLQPRLVLRDVGRVMQLPYTQVDRICKMIPFNPVSPVTLSEAIAMDKNLQKERDHNKEISKLLEISLKLEGLYRHVSIHAAGIVICDRKLEDLIPVYYDQNSTLPITQFHMKYVEKSGLVKFDFLGLKTLTVIDQVCMLINENIDLNHSPLNDRKTYDMLSKGDSIGIFQLESSGIREAISKLKPDNIGDIIALISLYRPGPMDNIPVYIARKHGLEKPDYLHPLLKNVLKETFGVIIYQEQVMEIARVLAGYSLGAADLLRRAMGKKIKKEMDKQKEIFINGAVKNVIDKEKAKYIFDLVAKFAGYGFNKSHAAAYALISLQTAYLKANFPLEFFTASMNLDIHNKDKISVFIGQAKIHNITILPPDINNSKAHFSIEEGNAIRYGLGAIKNVGLPIAESITQHTKKYLNIWNFINSPHSSLVNKRILESMIKCGTFDSIHKNRKQLFNSIDLLLNVIEENHRNLESSQASLFGDLSNITEKELSPTQDWSQEEKLYEEFSALGFYLTDHPLKKYELLLNKLGISFIGIKNKKRHNKIAGVISSVRMRSTHRGRFAIAVLSDPYDISEIAFYDENIIGKNSHLLASGTPVIIELQVINNYSDRLVAKDIYPFEEKIEINTLNINIVIDASDGMVIKELASLLKEKEGKSKVLLLILAQNKQISIKLPKKYSITPELVNYLENSNQVLDFKFNLDCIEEF